MSKALKNTLDQRTIINLLSINRFISMIKKQQNVKMKSVVRPSQNLHQTTTDFIKRKKNEEQNEYSFLEL